MKNIAILGSTGSIGTQTLEVVRNNPELQVVALAAGKSVEQMEQQIREFHPLIAGMWSEEAAADLRSRVADLPVKVVTGMDGLLEIASFQESDVVVTAVVGMIGIRPTIAAIESGKTIALANKETLVTAGHIIMPLAKECNVKILPVDSEHSAIFQSLQGAGDNKIAKILLTASGGPFRGKKRAELEQVKVEDALKHPNWSMGAKITIDSATMMNKGFEVIEAHWLFGTPVEKITVLLHPQSIVHSMVEFEDGAIKAQLGTPDMRMPISFALMYPRRATRPGERFDFMAHPQLTFAGVDRAKYPALEIACECLRRRGTAACTMNGANEVAVAAFLGRKCAWLDIVRAIEYALGRASFAAAPTLGDYAEANDEARRLAAEYLAL